jgi:phosphoribosyl-ATP pyrophosphohydrolase/phosphoribosyl-AMP cyclohydrolase/histidinol dehydrogenase
MTVVPARVAGVAEVVVASPRPTAVTLAAAHVAGADRLLAVGGAQAIAALAFGCGVPRVDMVVGPGNRYVTAAKRCLVGEVGIDGLAGPSELLVLADATADARWIAADLLAQAEHDVDAVPVLVTTARDLVPAVLRELELQLADLPTADVARAALRNNGRAIVARDASEAIAVADALAPEHLSLCVSDIEPYVARLSAYGALFVGSRSAEVFGDYGAGPNHVLPTSGGARFQAGLSVATFLRAATYLTIAQPDALASDCAALARCEGLEAHARAAEVRRGK